LRELNLFHLGNSENYSPIRESLSYLGSVDAVHRLDLIGPATPPRRLRSPCPRLAAQSARSAPNDKPNLTGDTSVFDAAPAQNLFRGEDLRLARKLELIPDIHQGLGEAIDQRIVVIRRRRDS
jgi:hypothetical protein